MKKLLLSILTILILTPVFPQQLKQMRIIGKPKKLQSGEMVARRDQNGNYCASIQVVSDMDGFSYDSNNGPVGKILDNPGEDIVYVTSSERVLKVFKSGYEPLQIILSDIGITLKEREVWQIKIAGDEQAEELPVTFRFSPEDAMLFIDGKPAGNELTQSLIVGKHQIRLERDGYQPIEKTITISEKQVFFQWQMEEAPDAGLQITTNPTGAMVYLDGLKLGKSPVAAFYPPGSYPITIRKDGFVPIENETLRITLPKTTKNYILEENVGYLTINTRDEATVYFNGEEVDNHTRVKLSPQLVQVKVMMPKADNLEEQVVIKKDDNMILDMFPDIQTGTIQVAVTPFDADIELTGDAGEHYTAKGMNIFKEIPVGLYTIKVTASNYEATEEAVILKPNEKANKSIRLEKSAQTATIKVNTNPSNAKIELVNAYGKYFISEGSDVFEFLPQGLYTLIVTANGYKRFDETITLNPGNLIVRNIDLEIISYSNNLIDVFSCSPIYSQKNTKGSFQIASACSGKVELLQKTGNYCKVKYENVVGYIPVGFIKETSTARSENTNRNKPSDMIGNSRKDNRGVQKVFTCSAIYSKPEMNDAFQKTMACDGMVEIISKFNDKFYFVKVNDTKGYIWVGNFMD